MRLLGPSDVRQTVWIVDTLPEGDQDLLCTAQNTLHRTDLAVLPKGSHRRYICTALCYLLLSRGVSGGTALCLSSPDTVRKREKRVGGCQYRASQ